MGKLLNRVRPWQTAVAVLGLLLLLAATVWGQPAPAATIAYSRNNQLRLIDATEQGDRALWSAEPGDTIRGLDWRPDGAALAFASDLEAACSIYRSDIYMIQADGQGLSRITNSPLCALTADFPIGEVTVAIRNEIPDYSAFQLYVQGAPGAVTIKVAPGTTKTITVSDVADLGGPMRQQIVVSREDIRWHDPAVTVNVIAGETAAAEGTLVLDLEGNGSADFGAQQPTWRADSSAVGFIFGDGELRRVDPYPVVAEPDEALAVGVAGKLLAWSPVDDGLLVANEAGIVLTEAGATGDGQLLVANKPGQTVLGLDWLPEGQGFVYSQTNEDASAANLYHYDMATGQPEPMTSLTSGFLRQPGVSPDGTAVVFERAARIDSAAELWLLDLGEGSMQSLGVIGAFPDWRPRPEVNLFVRFFVPVVADKFVGVLPSPTPTATATASPTPTVTPTASPTNTLVPTEPPPTEPPTTATVPPSPTGTVPPSPTAEASPTATISLSPTASPVPSATPTNLPLLKNGDFEAGPNGDWQETINGQPATTSLIVIPQPVVIPRSGQYLAWLGGTQNEVQRLKQEVTLSTTTPLYLQFYYQATSSEGDCAADRADVVVNGTALASIGLCAASNTAGWTKRTVDLGAYMGQTVTVGFTGVFDEATASSFYVDDVSFVLTP